MSSSNIYAALGGAIALRRKQLKLTQDDLSSRTGLSRASIANMERGHQNVAVHHLYAIALALKVASVSDLLPSLKAATENQGEDNMMPTSEALSDTSRASLNDLIRKALKQGDQKRLGR
ncbi:helix-turn-helix domain-containing protein [Pseudorhodobacter wandonensis]|uniref:helix-turn-helix domain-containing protein n=1 Tax=Pseudorhodobacter wandonensis TaxID=1120568 RepID=UPI00067C9B37|nr:helix-turn-helix domain-containing protein [Pseudorhodobacter wandonensis]